jgi:hypothetical protein
MESETAISLLPAPDQDYIRHQIAHNIQILKRQQYRIYGHNNPQAFQEMKTLKTLKMKLNSNHAYLIKADKGNTITIIHERTTTEKVLDFLENNGFQPTTTSPTKRFQTEIRNSLNSCKTFIPSDQKWKYIYLNSKPPQSRGLIKLHKSETPMRPPLNWMTAPAYIKERVIYLTPTTPHLTSGRPHFNSPHGT